VKGRRDVPVPARGARAWFRVHGRGPSRRVLNHGWSVSALDASIPWLHLPTSGARAWSARATNASERDHADVDASRMPCSAGRAPRDPARYRCTSGPVLGVGVHDPVAVSTRSSRAFVAAPPPANARSRRRRLSARSGLCMLLEAYCARTREPDWARVLYPAPPIPEEAVRDRVGGSRAIPLDAVGGSSRVGHGAGRASATGAAVSSGVASGRIVSRRAALRRCASGGDACDGLTS
jgi:hypothetical protein